MVRFINTDQIIAVQLVTPAENPLLTDENRLMDIWFEGPVVRKQMFKKVTKNEQEGLAVRLTERGFLRSGNLLFDPQKALFAEMESELLGGIVTLGFGDGGKPVELKVDKATMAALCDELLSGKSTE